MYAVTVLTPPGTVPVAAADLRAWLRLYDSSEDSTLAGLLAGAVDLFEHDTGRPVLATTYRQYLSRWPCGPVLSGDPTPPLGWAAGLAWLPELVGRWGAGGVVLGRGGVTAVGAVKRVLADGTAQDLDATTWRTDLYTPPARVILDAYPQPVTTAGGGVVSPAGYVEFTAGWLPGFVPDLVLTAIKLLAGHWYANREAYTDSAFELREVPLGWKRVVSRYKTGITGDWGQ